MASGKLFRLGQRVDSSKHMVTMSSQPHH